MDDDDDVLLKAWLRERSAPCPRCGYNLRGLCRGVCPECGAQLRLTVVAKRRWPWPLPGATCVLIAIVGFAALVAAQQVARVWNGAGWSSVSWELIVALLVFCIGGCYAWLSNAYYRGRLP